MSVLVRKDTLGSPKTCDSWRVCRQPLFRHRNFLRTTRPTGRSLDAPSLPPSCVLADVRVLQPTQPGFPSMETGGWIRIYQNHPQKFWMLWCGLPTEKGARRSTGLGTCRLESEHQEKLPVSWLNGRPASQPWRHRTAMVPALGQTLHKIFQERWTM